MKQTTKNALAYILPAYNPHTDTHYAYLYPFIESVAEDMDVFLVVEKATERPSFTSVSEIHTKKSKGYIGRLLEGIWYTLKARMKGYRDFYVHYSFIGALTAHFVTRILGGRVFYWNCGMPWLYKRGVFEEWVFRYILRHTILVTGAPSLRDMYVKEYGLISEKTRVLHNWIDTREKIEIDKTSIREKLGIDKQAHVVLFVHHLSQRKGSDMILPVARELPDVTFIVVGDGPDRERLEREKSDNVHIVGKVPHKDVKTYFSASDVFYMPSEEEGFPHVILEAQQAGVPYVASDIGAVRDISPREQQDYIIQKREPKIFAQKIQDMLKSPVDSRVLQNHVKQFDTQKARERFIRLFS